MGDTFQIDEHGVHSTYSVAMLATVPAILCLVTVGQQLQWSAILVGVTGTVVSAWIRYFAVIEGSFRLCLASSFALGIGNAVVFCGFASVPAQWFAKDEQNVATSVAVQLSLMGWGLGGVVVPYIAVSLPAMRDFFLVQGVLTTLCLAVFVKYPWSQPAVSTNAEDIACREEEGRWDALRSVRLMACNTPFLLELLAYSLLLATGFSVPAVHHGGFLELGYNEEHTAWITFAFIMSGVIVGLLVSAFSPPEGGRLRILLLVFYWVPVASLAALQHWALDEDSHHMGAACTLMLLAGGCSIGFAGICLPAMCALAAPVPETMSGSLGGLLSLWFASGLCHMSAGRGLTVCLIASAVAAISFTVRVVLCVDHGDGLLSAGGVEPYGALDTAKASA